MSREDRDEYLSTYLIDLLVERCRERPLAVTLDEAHTLAPEVGRTLLNASRLARRRGAPFLLVMAGTPNLHECLDGISATFWDRSEVIGVGRLNAEATREALEAPLALFGITFDTPSLDEVVDQSQQYPYFIQVWGEALCGALCARQSLRIDWEVVEAARPAFAERRNEYYEKRHTEIRRQKLLPAARLVAGLFRVHEGQAARAWSEGDLEERLAQAPDMSDTDAQTAVEQLSHLGYLWRPVGSLTMEPGIPSLMTHVLAQAPAPAGAAGPGD